MRSVSWIGAPKQILNKPWYWIGAPSENGTQIANGFEAEIWMRKIIIKYAQYRITSVKAPWDSIWNAQTHLLSHPPISDNIPVGLYPKKGGGVKN